MSKYFEADDGIKFKVRENKTALACGALAISLAFFIPAMRLLHPSGKGGGALFYLPLFCMLVGGVACLLLYFNRKLIVDETNICYVNWIGSTKRFLLDEIGCCKMGAGSSMNQIVLYDLDGKKLCKLDFEMQGIAEFYQYLADNRVKTEWAVKRTDHVKSFMNLFDAIQKETAVSAEEIRECSEQFYKEVERIFRDWEDRNKQFQAEWEIGFAEYTAEDLRKKCRFPERTSSIPDPMKSIPESYECVLEAYLKRKDEYVVTNRGEEVKIVLPYLSKTKSYQIGEKTRIRKADERSMEEWLEEQLETFHKELPKRRFHTETLVMKHKLHTTAGITAVDAPKKVRKKAKKKIQAKAKKRAQAKTKGKIQAKAKKKVQAKAPKKVQTKTRKQIRKKRGRRKIQLVNRTR